FGGVRTWHTVFPLKGGRRPCARLVGPSKLPTDHMSNPLLESGGLPDFSAIRAEHVEPAIDQILADNRAVVRDLLAQPRPFTWKNLVEPLEVIEDRLSRAWSPVSHLSS